MQLIDQKISLAELTVLSHKMFGELVKAVVDIGQNLVCIDADFHADQERFLLEEQDSQQKDLWGINLHPDKWGTPGFIEFDSMINIRPSMGNLTRSVENEKIQQIIRALILSKVTP